MKYKKILYSFIYILSLLCVNLLVAQEKSLSDYLRPGSYKVGLKISWERDYSRSLIAKSEYLKDLPFDKRARPVRMYIWYPAQATNAVKTASLEDYFHFMAEDFRPDLKPAPGGKKELSPFIRSLGLSDEKLRAILEKKTFAILNAKPLSGSFPIIIVGQGLYFESPVSHALLCEYLASYGYVVATCPLMGSYSRSMTLDITDLETEVRDMEFVLSKIRNLQDANMERIGLIGFDLGGMASVLFQMKNPAIDAVVSFDAGIMYEHNTKLLNQSSYYRPRSLRAPLLHFIHPKNEIEKEGIKEDFTLYDSSAFSKKYIVKISNMRHVDFTSFPLMGLYERAGRENSKSCYKAVAAYTLNFLNRYLKDQEDGQVFLERNPRQNVDSSVTIAIESSGYKPIPPGINDFENVIFARGIKAGIDLFRNAGKQSPELQNEAAVNRLAYDMLYKFDKVNEAVEIFKLNIELHPQSSNAYDSMGEAYMMRGDRLLAIQNYEISLRLDPKNSNAVEKLQQLKANIKN